MSGGVGKSQIEEGLLTFHIQSKESCTVKPRTVSTPNMKMIFDYFDLTKLERERN